MDTPTATEPRRRRSRPKRCRVCTLPAEQAGPISFRGKCAPCGERLAAEAIVSMRLKHGDVWQRWALGMVDAGREATGGRVLLALPGGVPLPASQCDAA